MIISNRKKVLAINIFMMAILFGLVSFNKETLRPYFSNKPFFSILTGCFPNFIAAFIISLAIVNSALIKKIKKSRLIVYGCSFAVFAILAFEEIKPLWGASTQYDPYDILASGIGALCAVLVFELVVFFQKKNNNNQH